MQHERETLCKYRLERAKEDLQAAHVNHESGLFKAAINRSYYAIFHSIRAVNILDGISIMCIPVNLIEEYIRLLMGLIVSGKNATIVIFSWLQKKNPLYNWNMRRLL